MNRRQTLKRVKILALCIAICFSILTLLNVSHSLNVIATMINSGVSIWLALVTKH